MSESRQLLADTVERVFGDLSNSGDEGASRWRDVEELGIPRLLVPEINGGFGGNWEDAFVVLHAAGRHCLALPIGEAILAHRLADAAHLSLADGVATFCVDWDGQIARIEGELRFTGSLRAVPRGRAATSILLVATLNAKPHVVVIETKGKGVLRQDRNLADEPRDSIDLDAVPVVASALDIPESRSILHYAALMRAAQMSGALENALSLSISYARERKQFGRVIGQFQAVQQDLARFGEEAAASTCAVRSACRAALGGTAEFQIAAAKLRANVATATGTAIAHQVHAAMGFTREFALRKATQRLWSWRSEYGSDRYWSEWIGGRIMERGPDHLWSDLTGRDDAAALNRVRETGS